MSDIAELRAKVEDHDKRLTIVETRQEEQQRQLDLLYGVPGTLQVLEVQVTAIRTMIEEDREERRRDVEAKLKKLDELERQRATSSKDDTKGVGTNVLYEVIRLLVTALLAILGVRLTGM